MTIPIVTTCLGIDYQADSTRDLSLNYFLEKHFQPNLTEALLSGFFFYVSCYGESKVHTPLNSPISDDLANKAEGVYTLKIGWDPHMEYRKVILRR